MATIIDGTQYALTSPIEKNHSVVFVKLTDSALKAIEDYALALSNGNVSNSVKPLIELRQNNSQGVITIPNRINDNGNRKENGNVLLDDVERQCYNFSVKDIQNDGILECVKQTTSNMSMESLGKIMLRMQIHANDDIYQKTKVKMAVVAEQELKKYNTKVINSNDVNSRKVKTKRPFNSKFLNSLATQVNSGTHPPLTFYNKPANMPRFNKYSNANTNNINNNNNNQTQTQSQPKQASNSGFYSNNNNQLDSKKLRELLIQILATKSHKLVDILAKMQEKVKDTIDKNIVMGILNNIATFKDGFYTIADTILNDDNCPDDSRNGISKRNPTIQTNLLDVQSTVNNNNNTNNNKYNNSLTPNRISNGNSISPYSDASPNSLNASPNNKSNSPFTNKNNVKRNPDFLQTTSNNKKFKMDNARLQISKSQANGSIVSGYSPFDKMNINSEHDPPDIRPQNTSYKSTSSSSASYLNESKNTKTNERQLNNNNSIQKNYINDSMHSTPTSSPDSGISGNGNMLGSECSPNVDSDEYLLKYPRIQDKTQLDLYKSNFETDFTEYTKLFQYMTNVYKIFENMKDKLKSKDEECDEWHELVKKIFDKYDKLKNEPKYERAKDRLCYLHFKLLHIKNMISDYLVNHDINSDNNNEMMAMKKVIPF